MKVQLEFDHTELATLQAVLAVLEGATAPKVENVPSTPQEAAKEPEKEEKQEEPKAPETPKAETPTAEDVREAMHQARERIEGVDYRNNTQGELYQAYHKALTAKFKEISSLYGSDKPSGLAPDMRNAFIVDCANLYVENGKIMLNTEAPF